MAQHTWNNMLEHILNWCFPSIKQCSGIQVHALHLFPAPSCYYAQSLVHPKVARPANCTNMTDGNHTCVRSAAPSLLVQPSLKAQCCIYWICLVFNCTLCNECKCICISIYIYLYIICMDTHLYVHSIV